MKRESFTFSYDRYAETGELPPQEKELMEAAEEACSRAYAPYSGFHVGAALRLKSGQIIPGANQENAAYPLCLCAERVALSAASSQWPGLPPVSMAITVDYPRKQPGQPAPPCGACRQVLCETEYRFDQPIQILLRGRSGPVFVFSSASLLLPLSFNPPLLL